MCPLSRVCHSFASLLNSVASRLRVQGFSQLFLGVGEGVESPSEVCRILLRDGCVQDDQRSTASPPRIAAPPRTLPLSPRGAARSSFSARRDEAIKLRLPYAD